MHSRIFCFIQWVISDCSHYLNTQVILDLISGSPFKLGSFHLTFSYYFSLFPFLIQQDVLESFCSSPAPNLESGISHFSREPWFLFLFFFSPQKWYLETRVWVLCVLIDTYTSLLLGPFSRQSY